MNARAAQRLFISDIDGTLMVSARQAADAGGGAGGGRPLRAAAGVPFSVVSSRPPRG